MGFPELTQNLIRMNHARQEEAKWWMEPRTEEERVQRIEMLRRHEAMLKELEAEKNATGGEKASEVLP
jgi:hypothetical protein